MRRKQRRKAKDTEARQFVRARIRRANVLTALSFAAIAIIGAIVLGTSLWAANRAFAPNAAVVLYPPVGIWFMLSGMAAVCCAVVCLGPIYSRLLGPPPEIHNFEYSASSAPMPAFLTNLYAAAGSLLLLAALLAVRKFAVFTETALVEQQALEWQRRVSAYSDIREVSMSRYYAPSRGGANGVITSDRALFIWFQDGTRWSPWRSELHLVPGQEHEIAARLTRCCGLSLTYPEDAVGLPPPRAMDRGEKLLWGTGLGVGVIGVALLGWAGLGWRRRHRRERKSAKAG
ncbi:MAG: hypothetical protein U0Q16_20685 [Bryobacteraceae bacterium]